MSRYLALTHWRRQLGLSALLSLLLLFWLSLPTPLFDTPLSSIAYSRDGQLLGARIAADEQWRFPALQQVPEKFATAIVQYEDKRFNWHPGVDPLALLRAGYLNISQGKIVSGGSTLSMQVIRLARGNQPRTLWQKSIEMVLALRLELTNSKQEILAYYASNAPFGGNVVGLEAAAWRYFGRQPQHLSWAETAMLAVLPNSPALVHPGRQRNLLKEKRDRLLQQLHSAGYLNDTDLRLAQLEPLPHQPHDMPRLAPHLLDTLFATYPDKHRFDTSVDLQLQSAVNDVVARHARNLRLQDINNLALLVVDNQQQQVLAYVGNAPDDGMAEHGHAVDIIQRPRSTGSILKPFLFAFMIEQGELLPDTLVADIPTQYSGYMPENYDRQFRGAVPAKQALARSLNVPAVRLLKQHGVARFYDELQRLGMGTLTRIPDDYGLSLILGGAEGRLWDMTMLYARLAHEARHVGAAAPAFHYATWLIQNDKPAAADSGLGAASAWLTLDALLEVNRPGIEQYWRRFDGARKVAWKTGTSYGLRDGWAIGTDARYTVGVWVGNASGEGRPDLTGTATAAPVLFDVFNLLPDGGWFEPPHVALKEVTTCRDDGYLSDGQCATKTSWAPVHSRFDQRSPHHLRVHLDASGRYRVHSRCESITRMQTRDWFVLPPAQAWYYRQHNNDYRSLPPWRNDCKGFQTQEANPIAILYPEAGGRIYIPVDIDSKRGNVVLEAAHQQAESTLYWHVDDIYLGDTRRFHQFAVDLAAGQHTLTVVDIEGHRLQRRFEVLAQ